jgi:hypothetical protein
LAITHVEPNGIHLQPKGLSAIAKVYGSNIFQGFLKENNLGSKLSLDWCLKFLGSQASFLTYQLPFLPTLPQLLYPNKHVMVFCKAL